MKETDLMQTMDAKVWTDEATARLKENMLPWFASAIMTGHDHGFRAGCKSEDARIVVWAEDFKRKAEGQSDEIHVGMTIALTRLLDFLNGSR